MIQTLSRRAWLAALVAVAVLASAVPVGAQPRERTDHQKTSPKVLSAFREVVGKAAACTVRIKCDGKGAALGTVVHAEGWILTKASELKGKIICQLKDGSEVEATIVGVHDKCDLAMLKIEVKALPAVEWSDSKHAPVGYWLASAGTGEDPVAVGVVSVAARSLPARGPAPTPAPSSAYLGVALDPAEGGAKVSQVLPATGAEKAGLKVNDIIVSLEGKPVGDLDDFMGIIGKYKAGDSVTLKVKRDDKELELKATLGRRPANRGDVQNSMGSELSNRRTGFPTILQHDQVIKPSDCGGPLVDLDGRVIGINIARAGRTESYAIPGEHVRPLLKDLMSGKLAPPKEDPAVRATLEEKLLQARKTLEKAEAEKAAAEKKLADARATLEKAESDRQAAEKAATAAKAALEKAEADARKK